MRFVAYFTRHVKINAIEDDDQQTSITEGWHMNEKGLKIVAKESLISTSEGKTLSSCDYYLFGKHHRVSFRKHLKKGEKS